MTYYYFVPKWFFGFDITLEILFAMIALTVCLYSFKIYKLSEQREARIFGYSFLLISLSYIIWALLNFLILSRTNADITRVTIEGLANLGLIGLYSYIILFVAGLITLAYTKFKIKSGKVYYIILGLSLLVLAVSVNKIITFRIVSVFLLTFILYSYIEEYSRNKNKRTLMVIFAFLFLLLSNLDFIFSLTYYQSYIVGHILELVAYILILSSLISSVKK